VLVQQVLEARVRVATVLGLALGLVLGLDLLARP
jgi:hypothetical protein